MPRSLISSDISSLRCEWMDTHFHLDKDQDPATVIREARAAGVTPMIAVAANLADSRRLADTVQRFPELHATAGIHPHDAANFDGSMDVFRELCARPKVCAVGEIGLDYYYEHSDRESQKDVFTKFLHLASELQLPAVIHCRDAYDDCLRILREVLVPNQPFEIHSYTGTAAWARQVLELGGYFSFNGIITFKKADNVRRALQAVPLDRLLLETDSPYLAPVPHRGKPNSPAYLPYIAEFVAREKGIPLPELAAVTSANAHCFFGQSRH